MDSLVGVALPAVGSGGGAESGTDTDFFLEAVADFYVKAEREYCTTEADILLAPRSRIRCGGSKSNL